MGYVLKWVYENCSCYFGGNFDKSDKEEVIVKTDDKREAKVFRDEESAKWMTDWLEWIGIGETEIEDE